MERCFSPDDLANFTEGTEGERLAQAFAGHLATYRTAQHMPTEVGEITPTPPEVAPGEVRLPHLVAYEADGEVHDVVMWERLPQEAAERWLGAALPDQALIESHLPELLALKGSLRRGELDPIQHQELRDKLTGRYLSMLFVYQHFQRFKDLWNGE